MIFKVPSNPYRSMILTKMQALIAGGKIKKAMQKFHVAKSATNVICHKVVMS